MFQGCGTGTQEFKVFGKFVILSIPFIEIDLKSLFTEAFLFIGCREAACWEKEPIVIFFLPCSAIKRNWAVILNDNYKDLPLLMTYYQLLMVLCQNT